MTSGQPSAAGRYLEHISSLLDRLHATQFEPIQRAATLAATAIARGRPLHLFGTGHSHMMAEEAYYRAGGLVPVRPLLFDALMLHIDAPLSTTLERLPGLARSLLDHHPMGDGDVLIVASNSGANAVTVEMAQLATRAGVDLIAITSLAHARSASGREPETGPRLHDYASVVIDNGGAVGDAAITVEGVPDRVGPTSTVVGAAIINAIVCGTVDALVAMGAHPEIFSSSNVVGGDAHNEDWVSEVTR